jgi:hypothetical protein
MAQIILDSNNNLIQGDFDNATVNNRTKFKTTTLNGTTNVYAVPNGSSTSAGYSVSNAADPTNASKITIATNGATDTQIISGINGTGSYLPLSFYTNNALAMQIDTSQNVSVPAGYLFVGGGVTNYGSIYLNSTTTVNPQIRENAGAIAFLTNSTERMRITSSGDILIGKTDTGIVTPGIQYENGLNYGRLNFIKGTASGTGATPACRFYYNGSSVGDITNTSTATAYNTSSDYRLKDNIAPMVGALQTVAQLKPVTYKWKIDGSDGQGFIAHELQAVVPDCVHGEKDAVNEDGSIKAQGIDTSFLVATLTAAIQEQQTIINELKTRIEALESK